jgi:hypothetical protein
MRTERLQITRQNWEWLRPMLMAVLPQGTIPFTYREFERTKSDQTKREPGAAKYWFS